MRANWLKLEETFHKALELEGDEFDAFLEKVRAEDAEMHDRLVGLLSQFTDTVNTASWMGIMEQSFPDREPPPIEGYEYQGRLGEGGMGAVYRAERRLDDGISYQVAVKFLREAVTTRQSLHRFKQEAGILAQLSHPNIAAYREFGVTDSGIPYLVMEFLDGKSINAYCRDRNLLLIERLLLFQQVCVAVGYAHQRLIIHRDIKPSNVIVVAGGVAKLFDFGIAKLIHPEEQSQTMTRAFTIPYAAPEVIRGESASTAADIFSLGVTLYELLTDRNYSMDQEAGLAPPASVVQPRKLPEDLDKLVTKELAAVIRKATHEDPEMRYTSVHVLLQDIENYMLGIPLIAQRGKPLEFIRSRIRHNLKTLIFASLGVLILTCFTFAGLWLGASRTRGIRDSEPTLAKYYLLLDGYLLLDDRFVPFNDLKKSEPETESLAPALTKLISHVKNGEGEHSYSTDDLTQWLKRGQTIDQLVAEGAYDKALEVAQQGHHHDVTVFGSSHALTLLSAKQIPETMMLSGRPEDAAKAYQGLYECYLQEFGSAALTRRLRAAYVASLVELGRMDEARALITQALPMKKNE